MPAGPARWLYQAPLDRAEPTELGE
jgi:hypothetical protein